MKRALHRRLGQEELEDAVHERADQGREARGVRAALDVAEAPPAGTLPEGGGSRRAEPARCDVVVERLVDARIDDARAIRACDVVLVHGPQCDRRV
jgi:hypothetical protein